MTSRAKIIPTMAPTAAAVLLAALAALCDESGTPLLDGQPLKCVAVAVMRQTTTKRTTSHRSRRTQGRERSPLSPTPRPPRNPAWSGTKLPSSIAKILCSRQEGRQRRRQQTHLNFIG
jgi:hypothetical protein